MAHQCCHLVCLFFAYFMSCTASANVRQVIVFMYILYITNTVYHYNIELENTVLYYLYFSLRYCLTQSFQFHCTVQYRVGLYSYIPAFTTPQLERIVSCVEVD